MSPEGRRLRLLVVGICIGIVLFSGFVDASGAQGWDSIASASNAAWALFSCGPYVLYFLLTITRTGSVIIGAILLVATGGAYFSILTSESSAALGYVTVPVAIYALVAIALFLDAVIFAVMSRSRVDIATGSGSDGGRRRPSILRLAISIACGVLLLLVLTLASLGLRTGPGERVRYASTDKAIEGLLGSAESGIEWPGSSTSTRSIGASGDVILERRWLGVSELKVRMENGVVVDTARVERGPADELQLGISIILSALAALLVYRGTRRMGTDSNLSSSPITK